MVLKRFINLIYFTLTLYAGVFFLLFGLGQVPVEKVQQLILLAWMDSQAQYGVTGFGVFLIFINFIFYKVYTINVRKEKIIAFDNPSGRVSVSLLALEDTVKRVVSKIDEVKDVRASISATRKGLNVKIRLVICSELSIPELTSEVQDRAKSKIQDTIGLDESIDVTIHVSKILPVQTKATKKKEPVEGKGKNEPNIPFQGYRA